MEHTFCVKYAPKIITIKQLIDNRGNCTFISFNLLKMSDKSEGSAFQKCVFKVLMKKV